MSRRKKRNGRFNAQVALETIKNQQSISQITSEYGVNPAQVSLWKKQVLEELPQLFTNGRSKTVSDNDELVADLNRQIDQLKVELDWLQKKPQRLRWTQTAACWTGVPFIVGCETMRAFRLVQSLILLSSCNRVATKPALYESVRWTVHQDTVLRGA